MPPRTPARAHTRPPSSPPSPVPNALQVPLGWTSLHLAVKNGDLQAVELLLGRGATANVRAMDGSHPLHISAFFRFSAVLVRPIVGRPILAALLVAIL